MDCVKIQDLIFRSMDGELSAHENDILASHLRGCALCARAEKIVKLPRRLAQAVRVPGPSPFFYQTLRARLQNESQSVAMWQILMALARRVVPAMACLTLALLTVFAYYQVRGPEVDVYQAYDMIFMSGDRPQRMVIADQDEITDESVLRAITEPDQAPEGESERPR